MTEDTQDAPAPGGRLQPRTLGMLALEVFSIVLGVLLALAVSEWQEDRDNASRANAALVNVRNELEANVAILSATLAQNQRTVAEIEAIETDAESSADRPPLDYSPAVQIDDSAWRALGDAGLTSFIEYDLLLELSRVYASINVYQQIAFSLIEADMTMRATATAAGVDMDGLESGELFARNFLDQFQTLVRGEERLIDAHQALLKRLQTSVEPGTP